MADGSSAANDFAHEPGLSMQEISIRYTKWAQEAKYDRDMGPEHYRGPLIAADFVADQFPQESERANVNILDVAAGSGFAGEQLKAKGFALIDALEPSAGMSKLAKAKGIYNRMFQCFLNGSSLEIESDHYDVALICGGMGEGHIPCSGLDELIRVVKPGGFAIIVMREEYLTTVAEYKDRLEPRMKELELENKWKAVSRTIVPKYSYNNSGVVYIYRVLENRAD